MDPDVKNIDFDPAKLDSYDISIAKDGQWFYQGTPINRMGLVRLFASVLQHDPKSRIYWLQTPYEKGRIEVEDLPFTAIDIMAIQEQTGQALRFTTNLGDIVTAGHEHPLRFEADHNDNPLPAIHIRNGLWARISRRVYYDLVAMRQESQEDKGTFGLWSQNVFFTLGKEVPTSHA